MKRKINIIISTSAASVMALTALAQDPPKSTGANYSQDRANYTQDRMSHVRANRLNGAAKASDLIGMTVKNNQDEKLGQVEDLAVDVESGRVVQVILSTGGFLGIGDTLSAVPPGALHHDRAQKVLQLDANKEKLTGAPKFDNAKWDEDTQSNRVTEVYTYYGEHPYYLADPDSSAKTREDVKIVNTLPRHLDGTLNTDDPRAVENTRNVEAVENVVRNQDRRATRNADGTWSREYSANENGTNRDVVLNQNRRSNPDADGRLNREASSNANGNNQGLAQSDNTRSTGNEEVHGNREDGTDTDDLNRSGSRLGYVQKASKLLGMTVKNQQNEKLGDVDNLMVDLAAGRIVAVIVSSGGFLGLGDELSAVPPTAFRCMPDTDSLQLDTTKEMLSNAPHFKSNQWPDFSQPTYVSGMYRSYHVEPYFNNDSMSDSDNAKGTAHNSDYRSSDRSKADNTARNVRDRNDQTQTPLDQGNSKADIATTARIRKEITEAKNLSVNAQNVKIITQNGRVTLRGPVNTVAEKRRIGEIANRIASSGNVDNQLEVQVTTSSNN